MKAVLLFLAIAGFAILFLSACAQQNSGNSGYDSSTSGSSSYSPAEYNSAPSPAATSAYKGSHSY